MTGFLVKKKDLYYYKCRTKGCKTTKSAKVLHEGFSQILDSFQIEENAVEAIKVGLDVVCETVFSEKRENLKLFQAKLIETESKLETLEERYAIGKINDQVFEKYNTKYEQEKDEILQEIQKCTINSSNLEKIIDFALKICLKPLQMWKSRDVGERTNLQDFIFPEGIIYNKQKGRVQTKGINSLFVLIPRIAKLLKDIKKGDPINLDRISALVTPAGFKPATLRAEI